MELERPPAAVAILVALARQQGCDVKVFDLNLSFYNDLDAEQWNAAERYWRLRQEPDPDTLERLNQLFDQYITDIQEWSADMLALSVFTLMSNKCCWEFLDRWHKKSHTSVPTIIAGGQGLTTPYQANFVKDTNNAKMAVDITFGKYLFGKKYIDHYVTGDGEDAFVTLLTGGTRGPGINGAPTQQLENLDSYPIPDYRLTDPNTYKYTNRAGVYVTASRGCVRKCNFCDVPARWPKFKYRQGEQVAEEIYTQWQRHGITTFQLTDSVVNGNLEQFLAMNRALARYRANEPGLQNLNLLAQFNVRKKRLMTEEQYEAMGDAGWKVLVTGVESGSERVRMDMGKEFTNNDLDWHYYQCAKWGISNVTLMFVGYPSETIEDHHCNIQYLHRYRRYMQTGTILMVRWGYTGSLDIGSPLANNTQTQDWDIKPQIADLDLTHLMEHDQYWIYGRNWINLNNPDLTFEERIRRRLELHEVSVKLGWPVTRPREELQILKKIVQEFKQRKKPTGMTIPIFADIGDH